jgi:hypothetical protein
MNADNPENPFWGPHITYTLLISRVFPKGHAKTGKLAGPRVLNQGKTGFLDEEPPGIRQIPTFYEILQKERLRDFGRNRSRGRVCRGSPNARKDKETQQQAG